MALKDTTTPYTGMIEPFAAGGNVGFGVAVIRSAAKTVKGSLADNADNIIGFSVQPAEGVVLDEDGFYQAVNNASVPDAVRVARDGIINALVSTKADTDIIDGDYLECAPFGTPACYIGVLNEAGSDAGETRLTTCKAQALEDVTMGAATYKTPSVNVVIGDKTVTFTAENLALLDLEEGDYIVLEDVNGDAQLNRVKSLTSTVVTLQFASTVAVAAATDLVYKVHQVKCLILK